ncbi:MAG: hypothetical protein H7099_15770, partial [Gemmatimonadaceae bacterium]|nr:hypothetical protein [Gemmatimonadaceae bacterium]
TQADAPDTAAAVAAAITTERTRIAGVLTIARVPLGTDVQSAIDNGHSVEAFALARARADVAAESAGADAHRAAALAAEKKNAESMQHVDSKPTTEDATTPEAQASRILANAKAAGVPLAGGQS